MSDADRYQLLESLGSGATSEVFVAMDDKLRREVAYKRLFSEVAGDDTVRRCFHREAQALARVRHKNVVAVHDYSGQDSDTLFLVMELVRGKNLSAWIADKGSVAEPIAWSVLHELGNALAACHAQHVIHRDLKPDNVILTPSGRLILVDFGIARSYDAQDGAVGAGAGTQVMGTPDFMSPEQAVSNELTGASDVFSLGAVLYFLITGKKPFEAEGVLATLKKIAAGQFTPLKQLRGELSPALIALVEACLKTDAALRPSAQEVHATARKQLTSLGVQPEALLADYAAAGKLGTTKKVQLKELDQLFAKLGQALSGKDKLEVRRLRKRILELDPDNDSVFELRAPSPLRAQRAEQPAEAPAQPKTVFQAAPQTFVVTQPPAQPARQQFVVLAIVAVTAFVAGAAFMFVLRA